MLALVKHLTLLLQVQFMPDTVIALDITRALELHALLECGVDLTPKSTPLRSNKITDGTMFDRAG
jgi:hypothetical protein